MSEKTPVDCPSSAKRAAERIVDELGIDGLTKPKSGGGLANLLENAAHILLVERFAVIITEEMEGGHRTPTPDNPAPPSGGDS